MLIPATNVSNLSLSRNSSSENAVSGEVNPRIVTRGSLFNNSRKKPLNSKRYKALKVEDEGLTILVKNLFFDWYQVTLPSADGSSKQTKREDERKALQDVMLFARKQGLHPAQKGGGNNGYKASMPFFANNHSKDVVFKVNACSQTALMPNVTLTGGKGLCAKLAPLMQKAFRGARLSRADVSFDYSKEGLFPDLYKMAVDASTQNKKLGKPRLQGNPDMGLTFYLGSKKSVVSLKVYQKDFERFANNEIDWADVDPHLVRIEFTFRPSSSGKLAMADMSPQQMVRTSFWVRDFLSKSAKIMNLTQTTEKLKKQKVTRQYTEKTLEKTVKFGVFQYAKSFSKLAIANLVDQKFAGNYASAIIKVDEIEEEAVRLFREEFRKAQEAKKQVFEEHVSHCMTDEEYDQILVRDLINAGRNNVEVARQSHDFFDDIVKGLRLDQPSPDGVAIAKSIKRHERKKAA